MLPWYFPTSPSGRFRLWRASEQRAGESRKPAALGTERPATLHPDSQTGPGVRSGLSDVVPVDRPGVWTQAEGQSCSSGHQCFPSCSMSLSSIVTHVRVTLFWWHQIISFWLSSDLLWHGCVCRWRSGAASSSRDHDKNIWTDPQTAVQRLPHQPSRQQAHFWWRTACSHGSPGAAGLQRDPRAAQRQRLPGTEHTRILVYFLQHSVMSWIDFNRSCTSFLTLFRRVLCRG